MKSVFLPLSVPPYLFPLTQTQIQPPHVKHLALATKSEKPIRFSVPLVATGLREGS